MKRSMDKMKQIKVYLQSLGCAKNQVDSELMCGVLKKDGCIMLADPADADVIIVNTCGFIESAKIESIQYILELAQYKESGCCRLLLAVGCMAEKYGGEMLEAMPELDGVMGSQSYQDIGRLIAEKLGWPAASPCAPADNVYLERDKDALGAMAYLKIAEGCSNNCSFCLIPQLRGAYKSRPMEDVLEEAAVLAENGVKELVLLAQDTTFYGHDLYGEPRLAALLAKLAKLPFSMIRLLYAYPGGINDELISVMAANDNVCRYLDMPVQHGVDKILAAMNRPDTAASILATIARLRKAMPDIALRTTLMVGFPGETEEDFSALLEFMETAAFDWVGAFPYYQEEDTAAALMPEQMDNDVKQERLSLLMQKAAALTQKATMRYIGRTLRVLVVASAADIYGEGWWAGRSQYQAPEVDGLIYFPSAKAQVGDIVDVVIADNDIYDLIGEEA